MAFLFVTRGMVSLAFILGNGEPTICFDTPASLANDCLIAALVAGLGSLCWYLAIHYAPKRNRNPRYPASFLYLAGSSVGLFLLGLIGGLL